MGKPPIRDSRCVGWRLGGRVRGLRGPWQGLRPLSLSLCPWLVLSLLPILLLLECPCAESLVLFIHYIYSPGALM